MLNGRVVSVSCVINFRLEQVITPSLYKFRSSSLRRVYDDYYFCIEGVGELSLRMSRVF